MIDHVSIHVTDVARARDFYAKALAPTGYTVIRQYPSAEQPVAVGLGIGGKPDLWLMQGNPAQQQHVAIRAQTRKVVAAFFEAGLAAGGKDHGGPGVRPHYHEAYYGAFVLDPDGNNVEVVCHEPYIE
ncbi:MAG TPA: VOC family protein [Kofleriaceae bacterium]|nr:VOC family protein [Kofleriaceae bacterium]